ncbi:MAG TPA: tetratricopeptide repeat protein [Vicinamibacteria bacterium]
MRHEKRPARGNGRARAARAARAITTPVALLLVLAQGPLASPASPQEPRPDPASSPLDPSALARIPLDGAHRADIAQALEAGAYDRAETLLLEAVERQPASPDLLRLLGGVLFLRGRALNAAVALKKAEALAPLDERSRFTLAMAYVSLGRRDWARPELQKLASEAPRNPLYVYWTSRLDYDDGQYAAAVQGFLRAIALDPASAKAHDNLGLSYEALGRSDEAIRSYQEAARLTREQKTKWPWPALNLGLALSRTDRTDEAEAQFRAALEDDPRFAQGHYQLGVLLERRGRLEDAAAELVEAARLDPAYPEPHYALARLYRRRGETDRADGALREFQRLKTEKGQASAAPR